MPYASKEQGRVAGRKRWRSMSQEQKDRVNTLRRARYAPHPRKAIKTARGMAEYLREYRKKNRAALNAASVIKRRARLKSDSAFRLLHRLRTRVWAALRRNVKSACTLELLGTTPDQLRMHLETQFRPGMTWENYGPVWHVDHRKPCASFDFTDPAQQRECFHFSNLQPLFATENLSKGNRVC